MFAGEPAAAREYSDAGRRLYDPERHRLDAAKTVTRTVPIVMASVANPVEVGLIESLARPGGNVAMLSEHLFNPSKGL